MNNFFEWDKDFETGNKAIDKQHYSMVELINELIMIELKDGNDALEKVLPLRNKISEYIVVHFNSEEKMMEKYNVDERHVEIHKKIHKEFINKIKEYDEEEVWFRENKKMQEIVEYLIRWLAYHILNMDKSLFRQIEQIEKGGVSPEQAYDKEEQMNAAATEPLLKALKALYFLVSEKNKELEQKNIELQETVEKRTKELTQANKKMQNLSLIDELTGLYNRRFIVEQLEKLIYDWKRYKKSFSVVYLDADKFKGVNDTYGHESGDIVLKWISDYLKSNVRKTDYVCRLGGDEFVIICMHCDDSDINMLGKKLLERHKQESGITKNIINFWEPSFSIGIAKVDENIETADDILKKADTAMYESKQSGRNKVTVSA